MFEKKSVQVKKVGNNLVASFHKANPPLIWNFDLDRNHSFSLALQGDEGDWDLGVTSPKGEFFSIAHFLEREDAEESFAKVEKILMKRRGRSVFGPILKYTVLLAGIAVVVFAILAFLIGPRTPGGLSSSMGSMGRMAAPSGYPQPRGAYQPSPVATPAAPQEIPRGVPVPADEALQAPR